MSRSSSSSLGSSLMRMNSLRTLGSVFERLRGATPEAVDAGAILVHGAELIVHGGGDTRRLLRFGDGAAHDPHPPQALRAIQTSCVLLDARPRIFREVLLDQQRGQRVAR